MKAAVLALTAFLLGCIATKQVDAQAQDPDVLYRSKCIACHKVYSPQKYTYQKLQTYVTRYGKGLSDEERRRILDYLKENTKQERN